MEGTNPMKNAQIYVRSPTLGPSHSCTSCEKVARVSRPSRVSFPVPFAALPPFSSSSSSLSLLMYFARGGGGGTSTEKSLHRFCLIAVYRLALKSAPQTACSGTTFYCAAGMVIGVQETGMHHLSVQTFVHISDVKQ